MDILDKTEPAVDFCPLPPVGFIGAFVLPQGNVLSQALLETQVVGMSAFGLSQD